MKNHPINEYRKEYSVASLRKGYRKRWGGRGDRNKEKTSVKISRRK
jgi:hypothetical protein